MKRLWVFVGIFAIFLLPLTLTGNAFAKSEKNKAACIEWCKANKPRCIHCYTNTSCGGLKYDVIQSFKKGTGNWYACGLSDYGKKTQQHKADCEAYCKSNPACVKCTDGVCGRGIKILKTFGGKGENWHACQKTDFREAGEENRKSCEDYCKKSWTDCGKCSDKLGCGQGWLQIRAFTGPGKNWYACRESSWTVHSRQNRNACKEWCEKNPNCKKCSDTKGCGIGYEWIAHFDQRDHAAERWYACRDKNRKLDPPINKATCEAFCNQPWKWCICTDKSTCTSGYKLTGDRFLDWRGCIEKSSKIVSDNNRDDCNNWCDKNENCAKCTSFRGCGIGYTAIKEFGSIHKWFSCRKR